MYRFLNNETGKFLQSCGTFGNSKPYPNSGIRFTWSKNGHFYRNESVIKRNIDLLNQENIKFTLIKYTDDLIGYMVINNV